PFRRNTGAMAAPGPGGRPGRRLPDAQEVRSPLDRPGFERSPLEVRDDALELGEALLASAGGGERVRAGEAVVLARGGDRLYAFGEGLRVGPGAVRLRESLGATQRLAVVALFDGGPNPF